MDLETLETWERELVGQCLRASVAGPFFSDWEFGTIFGLEREDVCAIAAAWPTIGDRATNQRVVTGSATSVDQRGRIEKRLAVVVDKGGLREEPD